MLSVLSVGTPWEINQFRVSCSRVYMWLHFWTRIIKSLNCHILHPSDGHVEKPAFQVKSAEQSVKSCSAVFRQTVQVATNAQRLSEFLGRCSASLVKERNCGVRQS